MTSENETINPLYDPYAILGVDRRADDKVVKRAYFKLVRKYPPETEPEKFQEIRKAYEKVKTPLRRAQTDLFLLQPPPKTPNRRAPSYDLSVHPEDIVRLAMELAVGQLSIEKEFYEPKL